VEANMQQEELAHLFSAHMNLSQAAQQPPQPLEQMQLEQVLQNQPEAEQVPKQLVYASQHYTHTHHIPRSISEPPLKTHIEPSDLHSVLLRNSIDPSLLFPSQLDLFQNADDDQRLRLLELWRISPPTGRQGHPEGTDYSMSRQLYDWPPTSLVQEETMAKLRYEREQGVISIQEDIPQQTHQTTGTSVLDASPPTQNAEPYMTSGYEMMAQREYVNSAQNADTALGESSKYNHATDPVYSGGLWQKNVGSVSDMENQYGAYALAREYNMPAYADEEMVM
jgi:hypothetical protein